MIIIEYSIWNPHISLQVVYVVFSLLVKGDLVHEAPAVAGSGEGSMYATLPPYAERLFP